MQQQQPLYSDETSQGIKNKNAHNRNQLLNGICALVMSQSLISR